MLNRNLDLDITKYASVNFNSLADIIDILGGVEVELTSEEIFWLNGYTAETSQVVGRQTHTWMRILREFTIWMEYRQFPIPGSVIQPEMTLSVQSARESYCRR